MATSQVSQNTGNPLVRKYATNPTFNNSVATAQPVQPVAGATSQASTSISVNPIDRFFNAVKSIFSPANETGNATANSISALGTSPTITDTDLTAYTQPAQTAQAAPVAQAVQASTPAITDTDLTAYAQNMQSAQAAAQTAQATQAAQSAVNPVNVIQANKAQPSNDNIFGWSDQDLNNAKFLFDVGKFGLDTVMDIMSLNYARDALDETRTNNAFNREMSAFNANNDVKAHNAAYRALVEARQKQNTGSTAGADKIYEQNKLTPFRG